MKALPLVIIPPPVNSSVVRTTPFQHRAPHIYARQHWFRMVLQQLILPGVRLSLETMTWDTVIHVAALVWAQLVQLGVTSFRVYNSFAVRVELLGGGLLSTFDHSISTSCIFSPLRRCHLLSSDFSSRPGRFLFHVSDVLPFQTSELVYVFLFLLQPWTPFVLSVT